MLANIQFQAQGLFPGADEGFSPSEFACVTRFWPLVKRRLLERLDGFEFYDGLHWFEAGLASRQQGLGEPLIVDRNLLLQFLLRWRALAFDPNSMS